MEVETVVLVWGVNKTRNIEHSGTSRNIPEDPGTFRNIPEQGKLSQNKWKKSNKKNADRQ